MTKSTNPAAAATSRCDLVLAALRRINRALDIHSRYLAHHHGLTVPQLVVLSELSRLGKVSAGRLATAISLSQATVTGIVDRLERKGFVRRERDRHDRRRVLVRITAPGRRLLSSPPPLLQESFVRQFTQLHDSDQAMVLASLERVVAMMEPLRELDVASDPSPADPLSQA
jgi:DNA-binding MarR family transcriptional regulator